MRSAVAILVALTACGDNIAGIALEDYGEARRAAECERLTRCGLFSNVDACERFLLPSLDRDTRAAIDAKKIVFNGVAATSCLAAIATQSCDATSEDARTQPDSCTHTLVGLVDDGAACAFDGECASGSCDAPSCTRFECCTGTCQATVINAVTGAACTRDRQCSGGFCGEDHTCHPRVAVREMCTHSEECDYGLACIGATEFETGRCREMPLVGETCPYQRCAEIGATCVGGSCAPIGIADAPCTSPADCSAYSECNPSGHCAELPRLGEQCTVFCVTGAWCSSGVCEPPIDDGAPCTQDAQCQDRYCRIGETFDYCAILPTCS